MPEIAYSRVKPWHLICQQPHGFYFVHLIYLVNFTEASQTELPSQDRAPFSLAFFVRQTHLSSLLYISCCEYFSPFSLPALPVSPDKDLSTKHQTRGTKLKIQF